MIPVLIHKEDRMEHLHRHMRVHRGSDLCDGPQIAVDELTQPRVVFHRAAPAAPAHVQLKLGNTESVLHVDQHQPGFGRIGGGRLKSMLIRPVPCLTRTFLVRDAPDCADLPGIEKIRDWHTRVGHISSVLQINPETQSLSS